MTDYAKHIETLENGNALYTFGWNAAINAAIDLMRAAVPKDAEAELWEREHCERFANEFLNGGDGPNLEDSVLAERAAARAEGYAQAGGDIERLKSVTRANEQLLEHLAACKAEVERLLTACHVYELRAVWLLTACHVYELRAVFDQRELATCRAKLTNLREAAERAHRWLYLLVNEEATRSAYATPTEQHATALLAAIEASR